MKTFWQYLASTCIALFLIGIVVGLIYMVIFHLNILACIIGGILLTAGLASWIDDIKTGIWKDEESDDKKNKYQQKNIK